MDCSFKAQTPPVGPDEVLVIDRRAMNVMKDTAKDIFINEASRPIGEIWILALHEYLVLRGVKPTFRIKF